MEALCWEGSGFHVTDVSHSHGSALLVLNFLVLLERLEQKRKNAGRRFHFLSLEWQKYFLPEKKPYGFS